MSGDAFSKQRAKHGRRDADRLFLRFAKAESYGAFSQRVLGPLGPGLNVVHGENEAGKTTFSTLIGGVMFGWEDGRGARNTYKPENAERCGALAFARISSPDKVDARLKRVRNADGAKGDTWILDDVDRETYGEIFSLNSDQLRKMGDASQVANRLLTAGAGTATSPVQARAKLESRIAACTSRSEKAPRSITRLVAQRDELARQVEAARNESDLLRMKDAELDQLRAARNDMQTEMRVLNARVDRINAAKAQVGEIDERIGNLERARVRLGRRAVADASLEDYSDVPARLMGASPAEDAALRERIESLEGDCERARLNLERARERYEESLGDYDRGVVGRTRDDAFDEEAEKAHRRGLGQIVLFAAAAALFSVLGIVLAIAGGESGGVPMGIMFALALVFAGVAVASAVVGLVRGRRKDSDGEFLEEYQWMVKKDKDRYDEAQSEWAQTQQSIELQLEGMGLRRAGGSLRAARLMLDRAEEARRRTADERRREAEVAERREEIDAEIGELAGRRVEVLASCGIPEDGDRFNLAAALDEVDGERDVLARKIESSNQLIGQTEQRLEEGRSRFDLDELRTRHQQVCTRIAESQQELARLLVARRMLDAAIEEWERYSQPEVYRTAERLLSEMTGGRWTRIAVDDRGQLAVADPLGDPRSPLLLSTGTCQQLYLALRIALLETADLVGKSVPVVCDDILVNFDDARRVATARSLARLARSRQVIVFTCHRSVVDALRAADPACSVLEI